MANLLISNVSLHSMAGEVCDSAKSDFHCCQHAPSAELVEYAR